MKNKTLLLLLGVLFICNVSMVLLFEDDNVESPTKHHDDGVADVSNSELPEASDSMQARLVNEKKKHLQSEVIRSGNGALR
jgi:hypothetical protein